MEESDSVSSGDIWCVVPVYNNRATIEAVVAACRSKIEQVVVVDDGSTDADVEALLSEMDITVLKHEQNQGKGAAILTALNYVIRRKGRFIITIDADGQHCPRDIEKFIPMLEDDETAIVVGCRNFTGEHVPALSRFGRTVANFWLHVEAGVFVEDCQSGFRAYPVKYLSQLKLDGRRFDFEAEVLAKAVWAGLRLRTVDVDVWYPHPSERVSAFRPFVDNLRLTWMHTRLVARRLLPLPYRRLIPSPESHTDRRLLLHPISMLRLLLKESATPGLLGVSAGVGVFLATLPLLGVHTLVIAYVASRLQLNKVMALSIQNLCMPPFVPMLCIELGYRMRYGAWLTDFSTTTVLAELHQRLFEWLLGSLLLAPVGALVVGGAVCLGARWISSGARRQENRAGA